MQVTKSLGNHRSLFLCEHCNTEVEKRTDTGKSSKSCGTTECNRKQRIKANWEKYPKSVMTVVEDLGFINNARNQAQHMIRYKCPHCETNVDIVFNRGYKQQSCGSRVCQTKALKVEGRHQKTLLTGSSYELILKRTFNGMNRRCSEENHKSYKDYGARGIAVDWMSFEDFYKDMGEEFTKLRKIYESNPKATVGDAPSIERIDSDGNYRKENCEWIPQRENARRKNDEYRPVCQINPRTMELIKTWDSARDAARAVSDILYVDKIKNVCNGDRNVHSGFIWMWEQDYLDKESNTDKSEPLVMLWDEKILGDCSVAWRDVEVFKKDVGSEGEQLIKVNKNEPWSSSNFRWESADYVRKDMGVKRVEQMDKSSNAVIHTYETIKDAVEAIEGSSQGNISACCSGRRKSHAGFGWRYAS